MAENNNVWRFSGTNLIIDSISSKNPMFNISSASSNTNVSILSKRSVFLEMWSNKRPGVPTTICG